MSKPLEVIIVPHFDGPMSPRQFAVLWERKQRIDAMPKPGHHPSMSEPKYANNHPMHPDNFTSN